MMMMMMMSKVGIIGLTEKILKFMDGYLADRQFSLRHKSITTISGGDKIRI